MYIVLETTIFQLKKCSKLKLFMWINILTVSSRQKQNWLNIIWFTPKSYLYQKKYPTSCKRNFYNWLQFNHFKPLFRFGNLPNVKEVLNSCLPWHFVRISGFLVVSYGFHFAIVQSKNQDWNDHGRLIYNDKKRQMSLFSTKMASKFMYQVIKILIMYCGNYNWL